ncbi:hypothetical protein [Lysobacter gummosus]|uniref:hypothetical protein n=1 Tax=Lysobacter gummosus TaxID=262324 RepID=UPI0036255A12
MFFDPTSRSETKASGLKPLPQQISLLSLPTRLRQYRNRNALNPRTAGRSPPTAA